MSSAGMCRYCGHGVAPADREIRFGHFYHRQCLHIIERKRAEDVTPRFSPSDPDQQPVYPSTPSPEYQPVYSSGGGGDFGGGGATADYSDNSSSGGSSD